MERIPNPVTGSLDYGSMPDVPPTRLMVLCRYGFALWLPIYVLVSMALSEMGVHGLAVHLALMIPMLLVAAGAHGSWWRPAPWGAWQAGLFFEGGVLIAGAIAAVFMGPLALTVAMTLLLGALLGVGASHAWHRCHPGAP